MVQMVSTKGSAVLHNAMPHTCGHRCDDACQQRQQQANQAAAFSLGADLDPARCHEPGCIHAACIVTNAVRASNGPGLALHLKGNVNIIRHR